jgi:hypothetical protein
MMGWREQVEKGTVNLFSGSTVLGVLGIVMSKKKE